MQTAKFQMILYIIILYLYCVQAVDVSNETDICTYGSNETDKPILSGDDKTAHIVKVIPIYSSVNHTWTFYSNSEANLTLTYKRQEDAAQTEINEAFGFSIQFSNISKCQSLTMKISNVTEDRFGKYNAEMKNDMGKLQLTLLLKKSGSPLPPRDFRVDCDSNAKSAKVYWKPGSYGRLNKTFNVYYRQQDERNWTTAYQAISGKIKQEWNGDVKVYKVERDVNIWELKGGSYEFRLSSIKTGEEEIYSSETKACNITYEGKNSRDFIMQI
ncbi:hypothetical protein FSP39_008822 [Pinctada imbricata]|uniref:Fibronectin type-III domain-containing protein n=1 Tax=Pinctada imbricata TaxID=66713 RepID=A0AA88YGK4_PINIB|nr:hypothetical protein FSP39_008822 [Pinctada imbricata]